ncbi:hypothetical protein QC823_01365 [Halomonas vilamensis]|uniref:Uncharacterized protein n=1 Tax=Vreelandella vilamensis TaxID=531309 RepID=A0ABU1H007_9GAMM|nr:hypothetical protein [Halomonas vilamensis]MDR5897645.1 hypothetical protein [Halomonas vilamensis]
MDTKESKTPEEEKEHLTNERKPENYAASKPEKQPEAQKPAGGMQKILPLIIIGVGILVVALLFFGGAD